MSGAREALVGQEAVQAELFRALNNFVREGRPNRILLHARSQRLGEEHRRGVHHARARALLDLDEGALYRFHWVFPNQTAAARASIGFGGRRGEREQASTTGATPT